MDNIPYVDPMGMAAASKKKPYSKFFCGFFFFVRLIFPQKNNICLPIVTPYFLGNGVS